MGRGETESGRAGRRWQSALANGGWLPGPPGGPAGPSCLRLASCLQCGTEGQQREKERENAVPMSRDHGMQIKDTEVSRYVAVKWQILM